MTATQYQKVLEQEIARLNKRIDVLILKGLPYVIEARRHRELVARLKRVPRTISIFGHLFSHASN
jgi:cell division protein FtsX